MSKVLVVPDPAYLQTMFSPIHTAAHRTMAEARTRAPIGGGDLAMTTASVELSNAVPATLRDALRDRRAALELFGEAMSWTARPTAVLRNLATAAAEDAGVPRYEPLEALGALIVDAGAVDRRALERMNAVVYPNVLIPLVEPYNIGGAFDTAVASAEAIDRWHLQHINISAAREQGLRGDGVLVGVLDTGIDPDHPELRGRLRGTDAYAEFDTEGRRLPATAHDPGTHGTHVCGLIAGETVGVAPAAELAVASVLTVETPTGFAGSLVQIATGLNWLLTTSFRGEDEDPGVDILNASLGTSPYRDFLYSALSAARLGQATLMLAAIGNSGRLGIDHHLSPGNYDVTIGVGAIDDADVIAPFSDWGTVPQHKGLPKPDLCAPGVRVWSSVPGGHYASMNGTSMATPIVTGACALLLQKNPTLLLDPTRLQNELFRLTHPLGASIRFGRGKLDLSSI
jgi:subtilisin family serine protease